MLSTSHAGAAMSSADLSVGPFVAHDHHVQFYESDEFLYGAVADFLGAGLNAGESVVIVATDRHREGFCRALERSGFDLERARRTGRVTLLDARETLSRFMVDGRPDWNLFQTVLRSALEESRSAAASQLPQVRIFGEMVDLLWRDGNAPAAIALEEMWNELARTHSFSLLCAYVMGQFYKESDTAQLRQICRAHRHVSPAETLPRDGDPDAHLQLVLLQQRARALEHEVEHRRALEATLREALAERRRAEEALRKSERELADFCESVRRQNDELSRTVRFSEMFVGILGHDLRNPLSAITTAASLLARRADSDKVAKPATRIMNSAHRMARMIDQLLDFTHIRLGKGIPLERRRIDLGEVCRLAIDELESATEAPRVELETRGELVGVWDGDRLAQLVSNLLGNALAHGVDGSMVSVRVDGTRANAVVLDVHNAGTIPDDVLAVIFEPFRSGSDKKQERSSGLGLGLYITQQIVFAHSGTIEVTSSPADGTRFSLELPRNPNQAEPAFPPSRV